MSWVPYVAVVVPLEDECTPFSGEMETFLGPRIIADDITQAHNVIDIGQIIEDHSKCREIAVNVRDDPEFHNGYFSGTRLWLLL